MANPTSSQKLAALAVEAKETFPLLHSKIVQVTGVLATPQLSHTQPFNSNLSLNDIVNSLATQLEQKARAEFGLLDDVCISLDKITIDSKNPSELDMKSKLRNLEPERRSSMGSCTFTFTPNPDFVRAMIAQKKELLRENLVLAEDLSALAPKQKKKGDTPKPKLSSPLSPAPSKNIQSMRETRQNLNSSSSELPAAENDSKTFKAMEAKLDSLITHITMQEGNFSARFAAQEESFSAKLAAQEENVLAKLAEQEESLSAKIATRDARIEQLEDEVAILKTENSGLRNTVEQITTTVNKLDSKLYRLYRRVILDDARKKLFELCNITRRPNMSNEDLHNYMRNLILQDHRSVFDQLGDDAFKLIFVGKLRGRANKVAHQATKSELSLAIRDSQLNQSTRDALVKVYRYAEEEDPIFSEIESQI